MLKAEPKFNMGFNKPIPGFRFDKVLWDSNPLAMDYFPSSAYQHLSMLKYICMNNKTCSMSVQLPGEFADAPGVYMDPVILHLSEQEGTVAVMASE